MAWSIEAIGRLEVDARLCVMSAENYAARCEYGVAAYDLERAVQHFGALVRVCAELRDEYLERAEAAEGE